jgi:cell division protease FtsH
VKPYSEETAKKIDQEISKMIEAQYARAVELLENNKDKLTILAELLLEKEVIFKNDLQKIFGKRPFEQDEQKEEKNNDEVLPTKTSTIEE